MLFLFVCVCERLRELMLISYGFMAFMVNLLDWFTCNYGHSGETLSIEWRWDLENQFYACRVLEWCRISLSPCWCMSCEGIWLNYSGKFLVKLPSTSFWFECFGHLKKKIGGTFALFFLFWCSILFFFFLFPFASFFLSPPPFSSTLFLLVLHSSLLSWCLHLPAGACNMFWVNIVHFLHTAVWNWVVSDSCLSICLWFVDMIISCAVNEDKIVWTLCPDTNMCVMNTHPNSTQIYIF